MGVITLILLAIFIVGIAFLWHSVHHAPPVRAIIYGALQDLLFIGETLLYWVIRKRGYPKSLAWAHLGCTIGAYLVSALLIALIRTSLHFYTHYYRIASFIPVVLLVIGNVFFILTIVKAFSTNSDPIIDNEPTTYSAD